MKTKKITLATVKSFIRKNENDLWINIKSDFDGMVDCVMPCVSGFQKAKKTDENPKYTNGIIGAWFVGGSRDYFTEYEDESFKGIKTVNCCGSFILAIKKC